MKICPKCRSQFPDSEAFCENCGGALEQMYVPPAAPETAAGYQSTGSVQTASDGKKTLLITMVIVMSVLILALIAVVLWFIASPSKDDGIQETIDADQAYVVTDITTNTTARNGGFNFIENTATTTFTAATIRTETTAVTTEATTVKKTAAETKKTTTAKKTTTTKKTRKTTTTTKKTKKTTTTTTTAVTTEVTTTAPEHPDAYDIIDMLPSDVSVCASYIEHGHTYFMVMGEKSWSEAAEICEEVGGYLAVVDTESEQKSIEEFIDWMFNDETYPDELIMENVWLGGYFDESAGIWKWVNGAPFSYINWDSWNNGEETFTQPDNYTGDEFYLRLATMDKVYENWIANAGKWNDTANEADGDAPLSSFGFLIEFDFEARY